MEGEERGRQGWLLRFSLEQPQMEVAINSAGGGDLGERGELNSSLIFARSPTT